MNCQQHSNANVPPPLLARRWFLQDCGMGLGVMALNCLLADNTAASASGVNPMDAKSPHFFCAESQERHLFVHGGRAESPGAIRQQATAQSLQRTDAASRATAGLSSSLHQSEFQANGAQV